MRALLVMLMALTMTHAAEGVRLRAGRGVYFDDKSVGLRKPEGVAFDASGTLTVADTGNARLVRYTLGKEFMTPAGEIRLTELPYPVQVEVDSKGDILALDGRLRKVVRVSPGGEFRGYLEPSFAAAQGPVVARAVALDRSDNVYILDIFHAQVLVLGPGGDLRRQVALPEGRHVFADVAVDPGGTVYAVDSVESRVFAARAGESAFTPLTGPMKADMAFPVAIAADGRGRLFVLDKTGGGVVILGTDGSFRGRQAGMGWTEGSLRYPTGICLGGDGMLFVADRENNRVGVFTILD